MKKLHVFLQTALAPGILFISSCSSVFYAPTSQTGHMFEKKGDIAASATVQSTEHTKSIAGDLAYAIDNRFFVNANYQYYENSPKNNAGFMEAGMGYYTKVGRFGFIESSILYGRATGVLELEPRQTMNFSMHVPAISGIIGIKNKYLFATFGVKGGLLYKNQTSYTDKSSVEYVWYKNDPGVLALEQMRYASFMQLTGTVGVKYKAVSLSFYYAALAGPKAFGTNYDFQSDQQAAGLRLQVNLNVLRSAVD